LSVCYGKADMEVVARLLREFGEPDEAGGATKGT
jgi:hypothetical protein